MRAPLLAPNRLPLPGPQSSPGAALPKTTSGSRGSPLDFPGLLLLWVTARCAAGASGRADSGGVGAECPADPGGPKTTPRNSTAPGTVSTFLSRLGRVQARALQRRTRAPSGVCSGKLPPPQRATALPPTLARSGAAVPSPLASLFSRFTPCPSPSLSCTPGTGAPTS